ncbi:MAG: hypothetical protein JWO08_2546 [Verrucomicrobiaceae bacterium]|nr:hypothetical protein [Verrucomicrobiaceae bacterium]
MAGNLHAEYLCEGHVLARLPEYLAQAGFAVRDGRAKGETFKAMDIFYGQNKRPIGVIVTAPGPFKSDEKVTVGFIWTFGKKGLPKIGGIDVALHTEQFLIANGALFTLSVQGAGNRSDGDA